MLYDFYFHNDFDGHAASAVVLAFLRSRGDDAGNFVPLQYDIIPQWRDEDFFNKHRLCKSKKRNPAVVVDFPYHPRAAFWFDHHLLPFKKEAWEKKFKPDKSHRYDDTYKSACHLAYDSLRQNFGWKSPAYLKELVKWLDVIDYANYRSAKQTIEMREPALLANNYIEEKTGSPAASARAIKLLAEASLSDFVRQPKVAKAAQEIKKGTQESLVFWKKNLAISGRVGVIDLAKSRFGGMAHYAPYYLHPKLLYVVRFHPSSGDPKFIHVNVSANPWLRKKNKKHIGELLRKYGGGGHKDVGGVEFIGMKKTLQAVGEFVEFLNKK